ncbi:MAG: rhodanese-like domain-containing protein [Actinobacteria bacterium]|nr:rhodanese-like domain-containing protein [Actinomycetota bacterium]
MSLQDLEVRQLDPVELASMLGTDSEPFLLDVREPDEVSAWSIPGAVNIPLQELAARASEIPTDKHVVVLCAVGGRSAPASEALARAGWTVSNLVGGMSGWATVYDEVEMTVGSATLVQVRRRAKGCLSYVLGSGEEALALDPSMDIDIYIQLAARHGWKITRVMDSHLHADHLSGARSLAQATGASLYLNPADTFHFPFIPLADGDTFILPGGIEVAVTTMHTPGHTEGSTVLVVSDKFVLTGDTLFVDGVGRPDLAERAEEFARNLHDSLSNRVLTLAEDTVVLPAHYGDAVKVRPGEPVAKTIGSLRVDLAPLSYSQSEFIRWASARTTERPPNYVEIIHANMGAPRIPPVALRRLELGPNRCSA